MTNDKLKYKDFFKNSMLNEFTDMPPAHVQRAESNKFSNKLINYIKHVENGNKSGYKNGKWYPIPSIEGGTPTIAYGHKITGRGSNYANGLTDHEANELLNRDLESAKQIVYHDIHHMFKVKLPTLDADKEEMLIDFAYNLGTLDKFPKFVRAVLTNDWKTAAKEYKRTATEKNGNKIDLGRNKVFFDVFLKPHLK